MQALLFTLSCVSLTNPASRLKADPQPAGGALPMRTWHGIFQPFMQSDFHKSKSCPAFVLLESRACYILQHRMSPVIFLTLLS